MTSFIYGKPIIATKVGAFTESIKHGVNGLLVNADSPDEFAKAMELLIVDRLLLKNLSLGAFNFGNDDEYNWDLIAKKTLQFYEFQRK